MNLDVKHKLPKKHFNFLPKVKPPRRQQKHFPEVLSGHQGDLKIGIRCGIDGVLRTKGVEYGIDSKMGRKMRVKGFSELRNGISCSALGDKAYKASQYSSDFYKTPGIVPGSTNAQLKRNFAKQKQVDFTIAKDAKYPFYETVKWEDKVRMERIEEELKQVENLDTWEATILKAHLGGEDEEEGEDNDNKKPARGAKGGKKGAAAAKGKKKR